MTPWKPFATSKKAALQSVTALSSASRSAGTAGASRTARQRSRISTAVRIHTDQWPSRPPTKRSSSGLGAKRHREVEHDVVVVAGVEGDALGGAGLGDAVDDVERRVAVERRDLDADHVLDRGEPPPEAARELDAADRGLEVEADHGHLLGHRLAVGDQCVLALSLQGGQAEQHRVIAEGPRRAGLGDGLLGAPDRAGDQQERTASSRRLPSPPRGRARARRGRPRGSRTGSCGRPPQGRPRRRRGSSGSAPAGGARRAAGSRRARAGAPG